MLLSEWISTLGAFLGGAMTIKLVEIGHQEYLRYRDKKQTDSKAEDSSLEPLLRAADELSGKLRSLAEKDFIPLMNLSATPMDETNFSSVVYLFAQFWSEVEIVRTRGLSSEVARSKRGKRTYAFLRCLESRKVRLIDRISQRAIGESALKDGKTVNFVEFMRNYDQDVYVKKWTSSLIQALLAMHVASKRQELLQYAVVVHAMIDTLDADHDVTRERPGIANKLNTATKRDLNHRVFAIYLTFVRNREKYLGPPQ